MLVFDVLSLQAASIVICAIIVIGGLICAYVSIRCINGKIRPNGAVGVRLNFSRNYRLYNQDRYWYDINRYGGRQTLPITIVWVLLGAIALILPLDPKTRLDLVLAILIVVAIALIVTGWRIYRYADNLVSHDKSYIPRS
jgi:uncharacterized membrane protein YqjE